MKFNFEIMISVLIPVYRKEKSRHFNLAMESIFNQTFKDFEVVLVADGPLTGGLYKVLNKWKNLFQDKIKIVYLKENRGLANALNEGLKHCSFNLVARMDSDDYSEPERLKIQYDFMKKNPEIDILGSNIAEFSENKDKITAIRAVPSEHEDIIKTIWLRSPMNHVTVVFKKESVKNVGGYDPYYGDDDYLWAKMAVAGFKFHNINKCLVKVRAGKEMQKRRGGIKSFVQDWRVRKYLLKNKKMNLVQFVFIILVLLLIRFSPVSLRTLIYSKFARKSPLN